MEKIQTQKINIKTPARSAKKKTSLRPSPMGKPHESLVTTKWHSSQAACGRGCCEHVENYSL
ncbi:MAG: hypothetical protein U0M10_07695 [Oscillospiraceae bacterium]|nr:hypothetical protein [Oscillospiraceae bacterium]